jgi:anti-sigma B factor antagonist
MAGTCDAEELHEEVKSLLENQTKQIVVNMQDVDWIGSLCIGALMREIITARQKEGDVYLAAPSQKVQRLFKITKLEGVVHIYPTVEEAVEAFHNN